ncbi:MAG TPA: hypothetical protein VML75_09225 [Kofleriaceae bacterium]|nr:hypothetical protein [Kofleriaceae bacterium]
MRGERRLSCATVLLMVGVVGCATGEATPDARVGGDVPDASIVLPDARPNPDAAPGTPDAAQGTPDAMPGTPDAMPMPDAMSGTPDAGGCTITTVQLLANPTFDLGAVSWVENGAGYPIILSPSDPTYPLPVTPDTPNHAAWLGGVNSATRTLYQDVAIPAGATNLSVSGSRYIATEESFGVDYDKFTLSIRTTGGTVLETYLPNAAKAFTWGNLDETTAWTAFGWSPAGNYAGQTIRVHLTNTNDIIDNTNFFMDSYAVRATVCQ